MSEDKPGGEGAPQAAPSATPPAGPPAPQPVWKPLSTRDWVGFFVMVLGMFMAILDIQIVASSLAEIQSGLSASPDEVSWIQTSYLIAEVVTIPLTGWLARLLSTRWLFTIAAGGFTLMSLAAAFTTNLNAMIACRALQGLFGGAMIPTVFASIYLLFPPQKRSGVSVLIGLVATLAPTLGPTLGGYVTDWLSWHWLFLLNIVPGIIIVSCVPFLVRFDKPNPALLKSFDLWGVLFIALFLASLQYVLEEGPRKDWFADESVLAFAIASTVGGIAFFTRAFMAKAPIVDLWAFRNGNFALGCVYSFVLGIGLYGSVFLIPLFLERVRAFNSVQIGLVMMVTGICQLVGSPIAGFLTRKLDGRLVLALGFGLFALAQWLAAGVTSDWGFDQLMLPQGIRGLALMLCFLPVNQLALGRLARTEVQNASGLYNLMRNLGGAIGLAVLNTFLNTRTDVHLRQLESAVNSTRPGVTTWLDSLSAAIAARAPSLDADLAALKVAAQTVYREALVQAFHDGFALMGVLFLGALAIMPFMRKVTPAGGGGGGH